MALLPSSPSILLVLFCFAESVNVGMTNCLAGLILSVWDLFVSKCSGLND